MNKEKEKEDKSIQKLEKEQREVEVFDKNIRGILEEILNKKGLKIGRKVLDEIYLHKDKIEVSIRKSNFFDYYIVKVGVHQVTGLHEDEIEFIKKEGLREKSLNTFKIEEENEKQTS